MGFTLWVDKELAWAAGTYEYRAMGAAVISNTDMFRARDLHRHRGAPSESDPSFAGYFASLEHLNEYLARHRGHKPNRGRSGYSK